MPVKHRLKPCGGHMSFSAPYAANPARIGIQSRSGIKKGRKSPRFACKYKRNSNRVQPTAAGINTKFKQMHI